MAKDRRLGKVTVTSDLWGPNFISSSLSPCARRVVNLKTFCQGVPIMKCSQKWDGWTEVCTKNKQFSASGPTVTDTVAQVEVTVDVLMSVP